MWMLMYVSGFLAFLLLAVLVGVVVGMLSHRHRWLKGGLVCFSILMLPVADFAASRMYFQYLCRTQGGLKVFERVRGVEGYLILNSGGDWTDDMEDVPYRFIETEWHGEFTRYTKMSDGTVQKEEVEKPISEYAQRLIQDRYELFNIGRAYYEIVEIDTARVVARKTKFGASWTTFRPWLQQESCPFSISEGPDIATETFAPVNK